MTSLERLSFAVWRQFAAANFASFLLWVVFPQQEGWDWTDSFGFDLTRWPTAHSEGIVANSLCESKLAVAPALWGVYPIRDLVDTELYLARVGS
jgi:hypothetical protein